MDLGIEGDVALVTGSSAGLGHAVARTLATEGVDVVINGRDERQLAAAVSDLESEGTAAVVGCQGDITVKDDIEHLVDFTVDEFGGIDNLVISGGGPPPKELLETTDEDFYDAFELLVLSTARLIRYSASHLQGDGGGSIVINSATSVKEPLEWHVLSSGVRIGAIGMQRSVLRELAPDVRVNSILPGPHDTERFHAVFEELVEKEYYPSKEAALERIREEIPVGRIGDPAELGATVAFLCSERAAYINGVAIPHDGGAGNSVF